MDKIKIGKIVNTHGIKGELKVAIEDQNFFKNDIEVFVKYKDEFISYKLNSFRMHKNHMLITIGEYNNINDVLKYKNCDLYTQRIEDELYESDLIGFKVVESDLVIGIVADIINNNAHDILLLDNNIMIPYVDEFIKEINENDNTIVVELIEGMKNED